MTEPLVLPGIPTAAIKKADIGKFKPKLTEEDRYAILGLAAYGVKRDLLAAAFDVDRRTVSHIVNEHGAHYKSTRMEMKRLGRDAFISKYVTEDYVARVAALTPKEEPGKPKVIKAVSIRSNGMQGYHSVQPDQCAYKHRIEIQFMSPPEVGEEGWHYRDIDSSTPEEWLHNGPDSLKTSKTCYDHLLANLVDDHDNA